MVMVIMAMVTMVTVVTVVVVMVMMSAFRLSSGNDLVPVIVLGVGVVKAHYDGIKKVTFFVSDADVAINSERSASGQRCELISTRASRR